MGRRRLAAAIISSYFTLAFNCPPNFGRRRRRRTLHTSRRRSWPSHEHALRGHIRFLASDLLEGRGPGSRGDELAQHYIAAQFESLGLKPILPDNSWFQSVPLVGVTARVPDTVTFRQGQQSLALKRHDDYVFSSGNAQPEVAIDNAEIVFVGYGIQAPEYQWDDFKAADLRGKILLMMNNDPADDPQLFAGRRRLYYGRWDYKFASAARQGAAGAIIIHTTQSAGYPFQVVQTSWSGEEFELEQTTGPRVQMRGWMTEDASRRIVKLAGQDLDKLRAAAERRDFRPVPLGIHLSVAFSCDIRKGKTGNVLGLLPGSDPELARQAVIFMAHHDHLGLAAQRNAEGDNIYNGAVDNASGTGALLAIARACAELPKRPARSILFAAVGAEEQGLLGSLYLAEHPPIEAGNMAAVINIDGINHLWPNARRERHWFRKIQPRRTGQRSRALAETSGHSRPIPRPWLLLSLRPVQSGQGRRAGRLLAFGDPRDRKARWLGQTANRGMDTD